jgi:hypothetical protein
MEYKLYIIKWAICMWLAILIILLILKYFIKEMIKHRKENKKGFELWKFLKELFLRRKI